MAMPPTPTNHVAHPQKVVLTLPKKHYAETPYTWDDVVDIIVNKKDLSLLSRSVEQERVYQEFRMELRRSWKSVCDYILHSKFNFEKRRSVGCKDDVARSDAKTMLDDFRHQPKSLRASSAPSRTNGTDNASEKWEAYPSLSQIRSTQKNLCRNDFPYYFVQGIEHWCLWKLCEDVTKSDIQEAVEELRSMDGMRGELLATLHWMNPPHLKSLPEIDHAHILCQRKVSKMGQTSAAYGNSACALASSEETYISTFSNAS